jgi:DNA repair protein RadC
MLYCVYVILVHNYSSADPQTPNEDNRLSRRVLEAGEIMGIDVLDRIFVCDRNYSRFKAKSPFSWEAKE